MVILVIITIIIGRARCYYCNHLRPYQCGEPGAAAAYLYIYIWAEGVGNRANTPTRERVTGERTAAGLGGFCPAIGKRTTMSKWYRSPSRRPCFRPKIDRAPAALNAFQVQLHDATRWRY